MGEAKDELKRIIPLMDNNPRAKEIFEGCHKTVLFELEGEDPSFYISVSEGRVSLGEDIPENVDILLKGSGQELARVVRRERDITHPIAEASLWIEKGKLSQLIIFDRILATAKRRK